MPPPQHHFAFGEEEKSQGAKFGEWGGCSRTVIESRSKNSHTINAECAGHCRGGESIVSPPTIPVARDAHGLSDASEPPRRELLWQCDAQLRIRGAQFHGIQTNINMTLIFYLLFRDFFGLGESLFPLCSANSSRCRARRSTICRLSWPFPRIHRFPFRVFSQRNNFRRNFSQELTVSVQSWYKPFSFPSVPSKSCERTTFPNQVLLLSF